MTVVDGHYDRRVRLSGSETEQLARNVLAEIVKLVSQEHMMAVEDADERLDRLVIMMQEFRKNCKKRKQLKVC